MAAIMILNGSPRAPRSNSKQYAELFSKSCRSETEYFPITRTNHLELCRAVERFSDLLFVFPLYADGIPVTLLNFLKVLEAHPPQKKPVISVLINCGFLEPHQNDTAVQMLRLYCKQNGYPFGSVLKVGSGEAILTTPFRFLAAGKIKQLASSICSAQYRTLEVTMPIPKRWFLKASSAYWLRYGRRNGVTKEEMETMQIEGNPI